MIDRRSQRLAAGAGAVPPPHAPHEVSSAEITAPSTREIDARQAQARQHAAERGIPLPPEGETVLAPLAPTPLNLAQMAQATGKSIADVRAMILATPGTPLPAGWDAVDGVPVHTVAAAVPANQGVAVPPAVSAAGAVSTSARRLRTVTKRPPVTAVAVETDEGVVDASDPLDDPDYIPTATDVSRGAVDAPAETQQPAGSVTDSPSRGIPRKQADPGKVITGGFGDSSDALYFPLDGLELKALIEKQLAALHRRIQDDLRFTMAICYPRVNVRCVIEVDCYAEDQSFQIPAVMPPHDQTPVEVARQHADHVAFVVIEERVEMLADGTSVTPPNATRQDLGLTVPRRQVRQTGTGRVLVDV